jgi:hypothetical protein
LQNQYHFSQIYVEYAIFDTGSEIGKITIREPIRKNVQGRTNEIQRLSDGRTDNLSLKIIDPSNHFVTEVVR